MGECELCGAVKVGVRQVRTGKTEVLACSRCIEKLNLGTKGEAPGLQQARRSGTSHSTRKNDLMSKGAKELAPCNLSSSSYLLLWCTRRYRTTPKIHCFIWKCSPAISGILSPSAQPSSSRSRWPTSFWPSRKLFASFSRSSP